MNKRDFSNMKPKEFKSVHKSILIKCSDDNKTNHMDVDRKRRLKLANDLISRESAKHVASFICDYGHKNGNEIHNVYSNGIIKIYNADSKKFITVLIARPSHIKRYYSACGISKYMPSGILSYCENHKRHGYNEI